MKEEEKQRGANAEEFTRPTADVLRIYGVPLNSEVQRTLARILEAKAAKPSDPAPEGSKSYIERMTKTIGSPDGRVSRGGKTLGD